MKRIYEYITKANQLLFFLAIVGALGGITYLIFQEASQNQPAPHVPVAAQAPEETSKTSVVDMKFLGKSTGFYLFSVTKKEIEPEGESPRKSNRDSLGSWPGGESDRAETVNVVFSKGGQKVRSLLSRDGLVISSHLPGTYQVEKLKALLFLCITEDTDENRVLDKNDRNDLYIVADGLERSDIVIKGVLGFDVVSATHLLVKTREGESVRFFDYDTETQEKTEVIWR